MRQLQQCKNGARCKLTVDQDRRLKHGLGLSAVALRLTASQATVAPSESKLQAGILGHAERRSAAARNRLLLD
jgi:acyl dehydratase